MSMISSIFDCIIFDIRSLQKSEIDYTPLDRMIEAFVTCLPSFVEERGNVVLFADHDREVPPAFAKWRDRVVHAPPFRREAVLVIEPCGYVPALLDLLQPQVRATAQVLTLGDKVTNAPEISVRPGDKEQILTVRHRTASGEHEFLATAPVVVHDGLRAALDPLEKVEAEVLFGDATPIILVDGELAKSKDIMRGLLGLTRSSSARILVWGRDSAVQVPEVSVLRGGAALLGEVARRSVAVLVPAAGGAQALSRPEATQIGARCLIVGDNLNLHGLDELAMLPTAGAGTPSGPPDYTSFWTQIFAALPAPVVRAAPVHPRIALVTPMFPQPGGPPHFSLDLALELTKIADVEVWTDGDMLPAHRAKVSAVFRLDTSFDPGRYDGIVYVLGNHLMYTRIFDLMREHGGALILHDAQMIDFMFHKYGEKKFGDILFEEYGKRVEAGNPGKIIGNLASYGRPFLREIVRHANPTIVHSPTSVAFLQSLYGVDAQYFPLAMAYPFDRAELKPEALLQAKLALGLSPTRPCIASFGEVQMMKGAKQCLFVMKELADWGVDFQFLFVGPIEDDLRNEMKKLIRDYRLQDHVLIRGGVSESEYIQHLKAVDLVLQIRQIPFGQVSGALLDAISAGMHGVASENLARSIEAPELIRRVNDKASPTIYAEQLAQLIESRAYENRPGPGWEDFTAKHSFARYARNLLSLLFKSRV